MQCKKQKTKKVTNYFVQQSLIIMSLFCMKFIVIQNKKNVINDRRYVYFIFIYLYLLLFVEKVNSKILRKGKMRISKAVSDWVWRLQYFYWTQKKTENVNSNKKIGIPSECMSKINIFFEKIFKKYRLKTKLAYVTRNICM